MTTEQLMVAIGLLAVFIFLIFYASVYNGIQGLINLIPEVESNIAVLIKKRTDLISKLLTIVDSYGLHERGINVTVATEFSGSTNTAASATMVARLASLRMAFPELKADSLYTNLMQELAQVETDIASRRERYNSTVRAYNTALTQFPNNVLLAPFGLHPKAFLSDHELSA